METDLVDATFVPCDFGQRLAQHIDMINAQRRYTGNDRLWDDVGAIVSATDSNLEYRGIDFQVQKDMVCKKSKKSKVSGFGRSCFFCRL